jgi:hypothetical protein
LIKQLSNHCNVHHSAFVASLFVANLRACGCHTVTSTLICTGVRHMGHSCPSCLRSASLHLLHSTVCLQGSSCTLGGASQHTWHCGERSANSTQHFHMLGMHRVQHVMMMIKHHHDHELG